MAIQNLRVLEALQIQPLSEEEKAARHILGRLYGPIASCSEGTRNGRLYKKPLWEKALKDDIFLEKVKTKGLFLELGHPADREETDLRQACACIPEVPKIVGDDLYAYVDILDTANGRLLKTFIDYGFVPGISSRGSGDVLASSEVDPETFFLETWDIVQMPAVKKARLQNVCESLDLEQAKLKQALVESYKAAKDEDKVSMKKALKNLNINIDSAIKETTAGVKTKELRPEDIPWGPDADQSLLEETEEDFTDEDDYDDEETETLVADTFVEDSGASDEKIETISAVIEVLEKNEDNPDFTLTFSPIKVEGKEYEVKQYDVAVEEDQIIIGVDCESSEELEEKDTDTYIEDETEEEFFEEETINLDGVEDSAEDNGDVEVLESLKEMIRQKEALETEIKALRNAKAVGDTKEVELQEKLTRYRAAFKNTSTEAAKIPELNSKVSELQEHLNQANISIKKLTEQVKNTKQLKESLNKDSTKVKVLNEELDTLSKKSAALEVKLERQTKLFEAKLKERTEIAKDYKLRFIETLNRYVESKASMLGVSTSEITSRLNESFSLSDVDAVCDQIMDSSIGFNRLPFGGRTKAAVRISESVNKANSAKTNPDFGYEIDDSLLELAGLK